MFSFFEIKIPQNRIYGLDILRAFAILFVLNVHSAYLFPPNSLFFKAITIPNLDGVTLFFVLSGFLIGRILIKQIDQKKVTIKTLGNFWIRRWFRTLPAYFFILILLIILGLHNNTLPAFSYSWRYFLFLSNFKGPMTDYLFPEAWSLNVEEWFYIFIPIAIFILITICKCRTKTSLIIVAVGTILLVTFVRYYRLKHWPHIRDEDFDPNFKKQVITRLDSIMYGVIGAIIAHYSPITWSKYRKLLFFLGIFLLYCGFTQYLLGSFGLQYICVWSYTMQSIGFLCLLPYMSELKAGSGIIYTLITKISIISYSLYLINYSLVKYYAIGYLNETLLRDFPALFLPPLQYLIFWFFTIIGAILLYKTIEKPFMNFRDSSTIQKILS